MLMHYHRIILIYHVHRSILGKFFFFWFVLFRLVVFMRKKKPFDITSVLCVFIGKKQNSPTTISTTREYNIFSQSHFHCYIHQKILFSLIFFCYCHHIIIDDEIVNFTIVHRHCSFILIFSFQISILI